MLKSSPSPLVAFIRRLLARPNAVPETVPVTAAGAPAPGPSEAASQAGGFPSLDSVSCVSNTRGPRLAGPAGIALVKRFEGCARLRTDGLVEAYPDPGTGGAPWTIGWGATGTDHVHGGGIGPGTLWTQDQCDARLVRDLARHAAEVEDAIGDAPTSEAQFDALVSFHYNTGAIGRATLTAKHRAGDHEGAAREFARWNRAGGRVMKGLVRRRAAEAELYLGGAA